MTDHPSIAAMKTLLLVDEIEARVNATTEGPWYREYSDVVAVQPDPRYADQYDDPQNLRISRGPEHLDKKDRQGIANAEFFAHSRADVLFLTALAKRQAEQLANVRSVTADIGGSDNFLNVVIARNLRRALGDEPEPPIYCEDSEDEPVNAD
jgi:hypothetical protein